MSILATALALAAGAQATPAAQAPASKPADHAQHQQMAPKQDSKACACCEQMAGGEKMACCEKHGKADTAEHSGHSGQ